MESVTSTAPIVARSYKCDGLCVNLVACETPDHFKLELVTAEDHWVYGDYPRDEAHALAQKLIRSRNKWSPAAPGSYWQPAIWNVRKYPRGGKEFWRRGPKGSELCVHQPHNDGIWRMYWGTLPIVRHEHDRGIFDTPFEPMGLLDNLAANDMKGVLFD